MIIQPKLTPKILDEYDVTFIGGITMSFTLDSEFGDSIEWSSDPQMVARFYIESRLPKDPDHPIEPEETTIFMDHVLTITRRTREVLPLTPEQKNQLDNLHRIHPTVQ